MLKMHVRFPLRHFDNLICGDVHHVCNVTLLQGGQVRVFRIAGGCLSELYIRRGIRHLDLCVKLTK